MCEIIMVGCDLHAESMLLRIAKGVEPARTMAVRNTRQGREKLLALLVGQRASGRRVVFAYEASGQGFGLYDQLTDAGIECHVLAPTKIARPAQHGRRKTDERDAELLLSALRAHILAGNPLPKVWIPDPQTRDDRELVRTRLDLGAKFSGIKAQIQGLLKRNTLERPAGVGKGWTKAFLAWLRGLARGAGLAPGAAGALSSLLRQRQFLAEEIARLDEQLSQLVCSPRYLAAMQRLTLLQGVGALTALVFLTEMGDLNRFANRRQVGAYLGLVPASHESGSRSDCKGHITRQGPPRVRRVLCQAVWACVRRDGPHRAAYQRIVAKNPKHKQVAVVASMRRLGIRMWRAGRDEPLRESRPAAAHRGRDQRPQFPPPNPHPLPSSLSVPGVKG